MNVEEVFMNVFLMFACYGYILLIILVSGYLNNHFGISRKGSRKFLHMMIGNLPFIVPFFSMTVFPVLVAAPFVVVTFLASPYSPVKEIGGKIGKLADITDEGHRLGLVFYAFSYTVLAFFFASKPYIIAVGILPMAYGDAAASIIGERYGKRKYKFFSAKSLEGSAAMLIVSFTSFISGLVFFSFFYSLSVFGGMLVGLAVAVVATVVEGLSPVGFDNLTVPILGALTFLLLSGVV